MKQLFDFFQDKKVTNVLDVGTGTGDFIPVLKRTFRKSNITAIDPDSESLVISRKKYPDVSFRKMNAENLDFREHSFDVVSISMALHHLSDIQKSFNEMQRVVKPEGWIIISELFSDNLNPAQEVHKIFHHFKSKIDRIHGISHNSTFTKNEIVKMVKNSGIEILFHFEFNPKEEPVKNSENLDERVKKMKIHLEQIKGNPEYELLKPKIEEFRERALKCGFQQATRLVAVGSVKL